MNVATFFHRPESNRVDPRTLPCRPFDLDVDCDPSRSILDILNDAWALGLPKGSARCGCIEIQTDAGIWSSTTGSRLNSRNAVFHTWDELDSDS